MNHSIPSFRPSSHSLFIKRSILAFPTKLHPFFLFLSTFELIIIYFQFLSSPKHFFVSKPLYLFFNFLVSKLLLYDSITSRSYIIFSSFIISYMLQTHTPSPTLSIISCLAPCLRIKICKRTDRRTQIHSAYIKVRHVHT